MTSNHFSDLKKLKTVRTLENKVNSVFISKTKSREVKTEVFMVRQVYHFITTIYMKINLGITASEPFKSLTTTLAVGIDLASLRNSPFDAMTIISELLVVSQFIAL